jgi:hypothetical protein
MIGSFQDYLPLNDLWKIVVVCLAVAVVSPAAAALVIDGFEAQSKARESGGSRTGGDLRIVLGVLILATLIASGILALTSK